MTWEKIHSQTYWCHSIFCIIAAPQGLNGASTIIFIHVRWHVFIGSTTRFLYSCTWKRCKTRLASKPEQMYMFLSWCERSPLHQDQFSWPQTRKNSHAWPSIQGKINHGRTHPREKSQKTKTIIHAPNNFEWVIMSINFITLKILR